MQYHLLATDYDGTIAENGIVPASTLAALKRVKDSGRKLVLVTGRCLEPLLNLFPELEIFDLVVAENGALLYTPQTRAEVVLTSPPPPELIWELRDRGVNNIECGRVIVATWRPHETEALAAISKLAIDLQIIFNKDAVMLLPSGCNKAFGLKAALKALQISPLNMVCVGDAENDESMLRLAGVSVAVANALAPVKELCHLVTGLPRGAGVEELCERILTDDLQSLNKLEEDEVAIGMRLDGQLLSLQMAGESLFVTGGPGGGKSKFAMQFIEQLTSRGAQACIVDPEGDYQGIADSINLGSAERAPTVDEIINFLEQPGPHCVVSVFAIDKQERPEYFNRLLRGLAELRSRTGRPHWIIIDEAHYAAPADWHPAEQWNQAELKSIMFITAFQDRTSRAVLTGVDWVVSIADAPMAGLETFCELVQRAAPEMVVPEDGQDHRAIAWKVGEDKAEWFSRIQTELDGQRHRHSLFEGEMDEDRQFVFRGAHGQFSLKATNLKRFIELAAGLDDETWVYHLKRNDYSNWVRHVIKDFDLADALKSIESVAESELERSREMVIDTIEERFTKLRPGAGTKAPLVAAQA